MELYQEALEIVTNARANCAAGIISKEDANAIIRRARLDVMMDMQENGGIQYDKIEKLFYCK